MLVSAREFNMKVSVFKLLLASALVLASCQARVIQEDELLEKQPSPFMEPMVYMPEELRAETPEEEDHIPPFVSELEEPEVPAEVPEGNDFAVEPRSGKFSSLNRKIKEI